MTAAATQDPVGEGFAARSPTSAGAGCGALPRKLAHL
jgi:hypothetical protein